METYIQTYSGKKLDFWNPDPEQICIEDIAHALSHTARFSGHTDYFYSVAQHSLAVSSLCPDEHKLQGLLHDATEAYLTDMPTPFKNCLPDYKAAEGRVWNAIAEKFGLPYTMHRSVKMADRMCLMAEADELQPNRTDWGADYETFERGVLYHPNHGEDPMVYKYEYIDVYRSLTEE